MLSKMPIVLLILAILHGPSAGASVDADSCQKLYRLTDLSYAIEPGRWIPQDDDLPAYCRLRGVHLGGIAGKKSLSTTTGMISTIPT